MLGDNIESITRPGDRLLGSTRSARWGREIDEAVDSHGIARWRCANDGEASVAGGQVPDSVSFEVVFVDNGSHDGTSAALDGVEGDFVVLRNDEDEGFEAACGQAAQAARGEILIAIRDDVIVQPGWVEPLLAALEGNAAIEAVRPQVIASNEELRPGAAWRCAATPSTIRSPTRTTDPTTSTTDALDGRSLTPEFGRASSPTPLSRLTRSSRGITERAQRNSLPAAG